MPDVLTAMRCGGGAVTTDECPKLLYAVTVRFTEKELQAIDQEAAALSQPSAGVVATRASVVRAAWLRDYQAHVSRETAAPPI